MLVDLKLEIDGLNVKSLEELEEFIEEFKGVIVNVVLSI